MTTRHRWIPLAAALALSSVGGCKKAETTTPDDATADDVAADDDADDDDAAEEPEDTGPEMLTKSNFDEVINDHMQQVSDCFVAALETNDKLGGKLEADFTFDAEGVPTSVTAAEGSTLTDEGLLQCIAESAKNWGFGIPKEAGMTMRYQYNLAPAG